MVDKETADLGLNALGTAIAEIIEDTHQAAVTRFRQDEDPFRRVVQLQAAGQDVAALASAMGVLARRSETPA
jgi:hypothetical protein